MSIFDTIFRSSAPAAPATPAAQPGNAAPPAGTGAPGMNTNANGAAPATPTNPAPELPKADSAPLDQFSKLWETNPATSGDQFDPSKLFQADPAKIQEAVSKMNFAQGVTPEMLQAIQAGGDGAMTAFTQALNVSSQSTLSQSMTIAAKMIEQAMGKAATHFDGRVNQRVKENQVSSSLAEANPALSHPAAKPIIDALKMQFTNSYPNASPAEITKLAQDYLTQFSSIANPSKAPATPAIAASEDWEKFLQ